MIEKQSDLFQTPQVLFDRLNEKFNFDYDVCANYENKLAEWKGDYFQNHFSDCVCFMNPPYSNPNRFVNRALDLRKYNVTTVCLLKSDTGTRLFHKLLDNKSIEIDFLQGRIKFTHPDENYCKGNYSPFPSLIAVIRPETIGKV